MKRIIPEGVYRLLLVTAMLLGGIRCTSDSTTDAPGSDTGGGSGSAQTAAADRELKEWMVDYMERNYLWNSAMEHVSPDYSLDYDAFLTRILEQIAAQDDINHDDGHWENGRRQYFYSNIMRYDDTAQASALVTRGTRKMAEGTGITSVFISYRDETYRNCIFILGGVAPASPAGLAGLKRGDVIERIDGELIGIAPSQYDAAFERLVDPSGEVSVTVLDLSDGSSRELSYASGSYEDNPIWKTSVIDLPGGRRIGYLCYDSFNYYYDDKLLETFGYFKAEGVDELVLDLRYNGGGHVVSSVLLGTFVAGNAHQGEVYMRMTYNDDRMASSGDADVYRIGNASYGSGKYDKIASALDFALGIERIYVLCSENTASASELLINGLRGLEIEVCLIGETTNGKNVGMESVTRTFDGYEYVFSPITFYSENAKGFSDYGDGFDPDVEASEAELEIQDWGAPGDGMLALALEWIETGVKPQSPTRADAARVPQRLRLCVPRKPLEGMIVCRELSDN